MSHLSPASPAARHPTDGPPARSCPACPGLAPARAFGDQAGFRWRSCGGCGTIFVDRTPSPAEISAVYHDYYGAENLAVPAFVSRRLAEILAPLARYRQTGRLLDAGFGAGALLAKAEEAGWECWGQEVSPEPLRVARERGWHVIDGALDGPALPEAFFDVVCMAEVIEHLTDPIAYLRAALRLLRPGGLLYLTTPNGGSLNSRLLGVDWSVYSAPEHVQLFSPSALPAALRRVGFAVVRSATEGLNPAELLAKYRRSAAPPNRVQTAYALNERLSSAVLPRLAKRAVNRGLTWTRLGDGIKVWAERPES